MAWTIEDRFPAWGESGESPPDGFLYNGGDQVNEKHLDYLWDNIKGLENDVQSALTDIDSDGDGMVDEADSAVNVSFTYKENDIDSDGDGIVDEADSAINVSSTYKGNDIDSDGDGTVDEADSAISATNVSSTYKGNDIDSDGDGIVDEADSANAINGVILNQLSNISSVASGTVTVTYGATATVESNYTKSTSSSTFLFSLNADAQEDAFAASLFGLTNPDRQSFAEGNIGFSITPNGDGTYDFYIVNADDADRTVNYKIYEVS